MIKATGKKPDGTPIVFIGLSGENVTRLMADEPIVFNFTEVGLDDREVVIIGGRTERHIVEQLEAAGWLPPGTTEKLRIESLRPRDS